MSLQNKNSIPSGDIFHEGVKTLNEKMDKFQNSITSKIDSEFGSMKKVMAEKLFNIEKEATSSIKDQDFKVENQIKKHNSDMIQIKNELSNLVEARDVENTKRNTMFLNSLEAVNRKLSNINVSFSENDKGNSIYYRDVNGRTFTAFIEKYRDKYVPDEKTLTYKDGKVSVAYEFNERTFKFENNELSAIGFLLNNGRYISADKINNDLTSVVYGTQSLTYKVDNIIKKLSALNSYLASNNFKREDPSQDQLTNFAISCISNAVDSEITKEKIPHGTKIKNTFDNHIWVFNHIFYNGLTTYKWEDFGSDITCIANNSGTLGLIAGSQEKYKGFVDIKGTLSINGLEEELTSISNAVKSLGNSIATYIEQVDAQFKNIENRLKVLEIK